MEFVVLGTPRTAQTKSPKSRADWRDRVAVAARGARGVGTAPIGGEVSVSITYFHVDDSIIDADNIIKPVLDASNDILWYDDFQVTEVKSRRSRVISGFTPINPSSALLRALNDHQQFLWVRIYGPPNHEEVR
jgi:Holliday junction resolvase RusA-like endonuclease